MEDKIKILIQSELESKIEKLLSGELNKWETTFLTPQQISEYLSEILGFENVLDEQAEKYDNNTNFSYYSIVSKQTGIETTTIIVEQNEIGDPVIVRTLTEADYWNTKDIDD